ncbi:MBL fold metallo-hydrolase [Myxococcota bacterium]|nr:MBL fold metallo-hydrolase [Myxococcota bacterium]
MTNPAAKRSDPLDYPLLDSIPRPGEFCEVADGVRWIRMPMPGRLNHINVWLLRDGDGWTIVDTGINTEEIREWWEAIFRDHLEGKPVHRVICTHLHNDHTGLAGWLARRWDCELWMSRADFYMCRVMAADGPADVPEDAIRFYRRAGFDKKWLEIYRSRFGSFGARISQLPAGYRRVVDGESLQIGGREWCVLVGTGHSPEHLCLHCPELGVLISGDQVLPRITPNVSVNPSEPHANPLAEWLASCASLRDALPGDLLVLPAHQDPFHGLHERMNALIEFHESGIEKLCGLCRTAPRRMIDVFPALFKSEINDYMFFAATGESIAHVHYALSEGLLVEEVDDEGVAWHRVA